MTQNCRDKSKLYYILPVGLCLIEVVSGKPVFDDIENDKRVFYNKVSGAKPNIPVSLTLFISSICVFCSEQAMLTFLKYTTQYYIFKWVNHKKRAIWRRGDVIARKVPPYLTLYFSNFNCLSI